MSSERRTHTDRVAAWREKRQQEGFLQTQIWLHESLRREIDARIKAGEFRNRSEFIATALSKMMGGHQCS